MADFKIFWPILEQQEGLYANNINDSGGETWKGISRNNYSSWGGWGSIDEIKKLSDFPKDVELQRKFMNSHLKTNKELDEKVIKFYKISQWDIIKADDIKNQSIANFLADWGVNSGMSVPSKHVQKLLGLIVDGQIGPKSITAINSTNSQDLFNKLKQDRIQFYHDVVTAKPQNKVFLNTWLTRTNSFVYHD